MRKTAILSLLLLTACASGTGQAPAPSPEATAVAPVRLPNDVHWVRSSAEYRAIFLQTYLVAGERLRELVAGREAGSWAVVLDADETVLDNSLFQKRLVESGAAYSEEIWNDWVREEAATALPGAVEFIRLARSLGGRVVIVTNRELVVCEETRRNLVAVGVEADAVLCRGETSNKNRVSPPSWRAPPPPASRPSRSSCTWATTSRTSPARPRNRSALRPTRHSRNSAGPGSSCRTRCTGRGRGIRFAEVLSSRRAAESRGRQLGMTSTLRLGCRSETPSRRDRRGHSGRSVPVGERVRWDAARRVEQPS